MNIYSYKLTVAGQQPIKGVGSPTDMVAWVAAIGLVGPSPAWILDHATVEDRHADAYSYEHYNAGVSQWKLEWHRIG